MGYKYLRLFITSLLILAGTSELSARWIPAWTRKLTTTSWKNLSHEPILKPSSSAPFTAFPRIISQVKRVKTNDRNFISHHITYSGVFAKAEKEMLRRHIYPQATLGRLAYLHDKSAVFYNTLISRDASSVSELAFTKHQDTLQEVLSGLETHYLVETRKKFTSLVFSEEEIARLQTSPTQPPAYLLGVQELEFFAKLPTLEAQRNWVSSMIDYMQRETYDLLSRDIADLRPAEFERYYTQNMRLEYFKSLAQVLQRADKKRPSAIIRIRLALSDGGPKLTDAQRAGYLQFMADTTHDPEIIAEIRHFNTDYGHYAVAEALEAPYEIALKRSMYAPELLGETESLRLRQLTPSKCLSELSPKIIELEEQLVKMRQEALASPQFYMSYYRVYAKQQIYKSLVSRAKFVLDWQNFTRK